MRKNWTLNYAIGAASAKSKNEMSYAKVADTASKILVSNANNGNDSIDTNFQLVYRGRRKKQNRAEVFVGRKKVTQLGTCSRASKCHIFVSRLAPEVSLSAVKNFCYSMLNEDCNVEKLPTKFQTYSSFKITCGAEMKNVILNPDNWEAGIIIRPFYDHPPKV